MYSIGKQRLFYTSKTTGETAVEVDIINPSLNKSGKFLMNYLGDDIYYIDVTFRSHGSYVFSVYENGNLKLRDILIVSRGQHLFYPSQEDIIV